jgi:putative phosphoesterase
MKVGLLADIHGNADALDAVLHAAVAERVERLLIAGDFVGYYHQPRRVLNLLNGWAWDGVRGNHEELLRSWRAGKDREEIRKRYGSGFAVALSELTADEIDLLLDLPHPRECTIDGRRVLLSHGAPWDLDQYVYPDAAFDLRSRMTDPRYDLTVFGHTHYPVLWQDKGVLAVNPGSVGQPRDRKPGACWALWDTASNGVALRREAYDPTRVMALAAQNPDIPYLVTVLARTS